MHIEKNICENLIGTLLKIAGKTKDTINARVDLEEMGIRSNLHMVATKDDESCKMPEAPYVLSKMKQKLFCDFLSSVKFLDGYASYLARCITADGCKLQRLKTHDCHILLQRVLSACLRGLVDKEIYTAIAELGNLFRQLCCKTLKLDVLQKLKTDIPILLCKLEKNFPSTFFNVMVHLAVHLPEEAILRGPIQYGWMLSYGPPWAHYLGGYQDRLLGGPLGLLDLGHTAPDGVGARTTVEEYSDRKLCMSCTM
jgi:hypothetical protein